MGSRYAHWLRQQCRTTLPKRVPNFPRRNSLIASPDFPECLGVDASDTSTFLPPRRNMPSAVRRSSDFWLLGEGRHTRPLFETYRSAGSTSGSVLRFKPLRASDGVYKSATYSVVAKETRDYPKCWSCQNACSRRACLICSSCNAIQPLDPLVDYFQIFDLERIFELQPKVLEQRYKDLQKVLHPDLASSKTEREQKYSAEQSAHVIQAYYTLLQPLSRARYLLELYGVQMQDEGTIENPELLMEIMELRELIDDATDSEELSELLKSNRKRIKDCENALGDLFRDQDLTEAVPWVQRLTYYVKVGEEITRKI